MTNKNIYIKLKDNCSAITYFRKSYTEQSDSYFYNFNKQSTVEMDINKALLKMEYFLIALIHHNGKIDYAYLGTGKIIKNEKGYAIKLNVKSKLNYGTAIKNICKLSELNLEKDFKKDEYVLIEESELISKQIDFIINEPFSSLITRELSLLFWRIPLGARTVKLPVPKSNVSPTEGYCTIIAFAVAVFIKLLNKFEVCT